MQDGKVWARAEKKAGARKSSEGSWCRAATERPKEAKAHFQKSANRQDSPDRPNSLTKLKFTVPIKQVRLRMLKET